MRSKNTLIPSFYLTSLTIASVVNLILIQNGDSLIVGWNI